MLPVVISFWSHNEGKDISVRKRAERDDSQNHIELAVVSVVKNIL